MAAQKLTIGELAARTGVATSALRYWEDLGLLRRPSRVSGQRRYAPSAIGLVGLILSLQDVGFTLREVRALIGSRSRAVNGWRDLAELKLAELDERITKAQDARTAIAHALACKHEDILACPKFSGAISARLAGSPLEKTVTH